MWKLDQILLQATESFLRKLRQRLIIIILIAVLPILAMILYQAKVVRDLRIIEAQENAWEIAENVAIRESRYIDSARQLLSLLVETPEVAEGSKRACGEFLRRFAEHNRVYVDLGVADADGNVRCRAHGDETGERVSQAGYFRRAVAVKGFAIGDHHVRGAPPRHSLSFALPVLNRSGAVRVVIFAALDVNWINQLAAQSHLPAGVVLSIVDSKGILLARFPETDKWVGKHIPDASLFEMLRLRNQVSRELVGLDGVDRLYALKPLSLHPAAGQMYVMVGIPKALAYGQVNQVLARNLIWLTLVSLTAGGLAWLVGSKFVVDYVKDRIEAEEERARLAAIVESSEEAIIGMSLDGTVTSWNDGAEATYGFSAAEVIGQSVLQLIPSTHHGEVVELLDVIKQGRGINRYESKRLRKDGQVFDVSASLSPIRDVQRNIIGASNVTRDITLLRQGEERLLAYTDQLESLNLVSQEIASTLSIEQVIERGLNRLIKASGFDLAFVSFSETVGGRSFYGSALKPSSLTELEAIGSRLSGEMQQLLGQCTSPCFFEEVANAPEFAGACWKDEIGALAVLPLGRNPQIHGAVTVIGFEPRPFSADERRYLQAMSQQIALGVENARLYSLSVQANEELRREIDERKRAERTLADFTAMVAHDLRSPLSNILSITDSIREGIFGAVSDLQHKWLWKVQESCRSLIDHVSDFLEISKIDAGKLNLMKTSVDLKGLLHDCYLDHTVEADKKQIAFREEVGDGLPRLQVDVRRISQVVENLLSNAFKFTGSGGAIELAGRAWGDHEVVFWVKDSGIGIPPEEFASIFDKYRQVMNGQHSSRDGTGLGLAICKKVVEAHGGRIWVESEPERGATFYVSLPVETAEPSRATPA
ncbi:MAG: ATP-binding protein [Chloroflexota bacterium]